MLHVLLVDTKGLSVIDTRFVYMIHVLLNDTYFDTKD